MSTSERPWAGDRSIGWRILLEARRADGAPWDLDAAQVALARVAAAQGWTPPPPPVVGRDDDVTDLLSRPHPAPARLGLVLDGGTLVLSAFHGACDGLGLLRLLAACGAGEVRSDARGVEGRPGSGGVVRTTARRLTEALLRPPAGVVGAHPGPRDVGTAPRGDVVVRRDLDAAPRTAELVHAAAGAVVALAAAEGARARHVAVAVGAGRPADDDAPIADRSALLRLRDVEHLDLDGVRRALATAVLQTPPTAGAGAGVLGRLSARAAGRASALLAPRLGSTLLVSHLGRVDAPGVAGLAFAPVTAGGTGLSLGAVTLGSRTTLTLRARAAVWDADGLERVLEAVGAGLGAG